MNTPNRSFYVQSGGVSAVINASQRTLLKPHEANPIKTERFSLAETAPSATGIIYNP